MSTENVVLLILTVQMSMIVLNGYVFHGTNSNKKKVDHKNKLNLVDLFSFICHFVSLVLFECVDQEFHCHAIKLDVWPIFCAPLDTVRFTVLVLDVQSVNQSEWLWVLAISKPTSTAKSTQGIWIRPLTDSALEKWSSSNLCWRTNDYFSQSPL